jgi:hypothetical protein
MTLLGVRAVEYSFGRSILPSRPYCPDESNDPINILVLVDVCTGVVFVPTATPFTYSVIVVETES